VVHENRPSVITAVDHILSCAFEQRTSDIHVDEQHPLKKGRACLHGRQTGYSGRDGIFGILPVTDEIRRLISGQADSARLFDAGRQAGLRTLREAAIEKVLSGTTTVSEMVRVTGK
jgi:type II secretory ATPase GspE/PulE/Tfp pilus assembly ATPase PilB-like protein